MFSGHRNTFLLLCLHLQGADKQTGGVHQLSKVITLYSYSHKLMVSVSTGVSDYAPGYFRDPLSSRELLLCLIPELIASYFTLF